MVNEERYAADNTKVAFAIGSDLTQWDNAQAALIVGELNSLDHFHGGTAMHTFTKSKTIHTLPANSVPYRLDIGKFEGNCNFNFMFQTGILSYLTLGACATTGSDPYTHVITVKSTAPQDPIKFAMHLEHEVTTNNRRRDMMGFLPQTLAINCTEANWIANQSLGAKFAYSNMAAADLAVPAPLAIGTHEPYTWGHLLAGGASNVIDFLYNSGAIGVDVVGVTQNFVRTGLLGQKDTSGYPLTGKFTTPMTWNIVLSVIPKDSGTSIFDIIELAHNSYVGDLELELDYYQSGNKYCKFTYDTLYIDPSNEESVVESKWFEGYDIMLQPMDENSSILIEEKNAIAATSYENT